MTEEEARKTICPKYTAAVLSNSKISFFLSELNQNSYVKCDASACQMWKWNNPKKLKSKDWSDDEKERYGWNRGHCGLRQND